MRLRKVHDKLNDWKRTFSRFVNVKINTCFIAARFIGYLDRRHWNALS